MEKKLLVESILEAVRTDLTEFIVNKSQTKSSIEYEESLLEVCRQFGREVIIQSGGKIPKSRNSKKKF